MSAIGDYIHYAVANYNIYGFNKAEDGPSVSADKTYSEQRSSIKNRMGKTEIKNQEGIEKALSFIFSTHEPGSQGAEVQAKIQKKLIEIFGDTLGKINWSTGNIKQQLNTAKHGTIATITQGVDQNNIQISTILKRVQALIQIRDNIESQEDWVTLNGKINDILHNLSDIIRQGKRGVVGQLRQALDDGISYKNVTLNNQNLSLISDSSGEATRSLIAQINDVLRNYAKRPAINLQKGDLFEFALAAVPAVARIQAGESVKSAMEDFDKAAIGSIKRTKVQIDLSQFTENLNYNDLQFTGYVTSPTHKTIISYGSTQNKIDVNLQWGSSVLPISAKNINLGYKGAQVVTGTSLLYLLQNENHDFVNHYLNAVATHNDTEKKPNGLQEAHELAKITVLYKAISGDVFGRKKATVFIVNDNRTGKVRIFDIRDLVLKAMENIDTYATITANGSDMDSIQLPNDWHDTYADRITALIADVHRQKISAILKPNLLWSFDK